MNWKESGRGEQGIEIKIMSSPPMDLEDIEWSCPNEFREGDACAYYYGEDLDEAYPEDFSLTWCLPGGQVRMEIECLMERTLWSDKVYFSEPTEWSVFIDFAPEVKDAISYTLFIRVTEKIYRRKWGQSLPREIRQAIEEEWALIVERDNSED